MDIEARLVALENAVEEINQRLTELEMKAAAATTATIDKDAISQIVNDEIDQFFHDLAKSVD